MQLYDADNKLKIIGTRYGEKLFETLINREELIKSSDFQDYYRIPSDNRDMNYHNYFSKGKINISKIEDYTSHNTNRLDIESTKSLLLSLDIIKKDLS